MQNSIFSFMELRMFKGVRNKITFKNIIIYDDFVLWDLFISFEVFSDLAFKSNPL